MVNLQFGSDNAVALALKRPVAPFVLLAFFEPSGCNVFGVPLDPQWCVRTGRRQAAVFRVNPSAIGLPAGSYRLTVYSQFSPTNTDWLNTDRTIYTTQANVIDNAIC